MESPPPVASPEVREAVARLDQLVARRPELSGPSRLYEELLPILFDSVPDSPFVLESAKRPDRIGHGVPLFRHESPQLVDLFFRMRVAQITAALSRHRDPLAPQQLADAVLSGSLRLSDTLRGLFKNGPAEFVEFLKGRGLDATLGMSVLRLCALPVLAGLVREIEARRAWIGWPCGYCPACGSWPLLAEFRGLEQLRWLRCGLCSSGWPVDRLLCPFCENRDHRTLQDLFVEGEQSRCRVSVCDVCRGFVRGVSTLAALSAPGLLVSELETLHLELIARERGYSPAPNFDDGRAVSTV